MLILCLLPLCIVLMYIFSTGEDCYGKFYPKLENPDQTVFLPGIEKFEAVIPGISKIDPTRGSDSFLSSILSYMSYSYIKNYFRNVCSVKGLTEDPKLNIYSKFCGVYK